MIGADLFSRDAESSERSAHASASPRRRSYVYAVALRSEDSASRLNGILATAIGLCLLLAGPARAGDGRAVAPFLDERTVAVLRLEPGQVDLAALLERLTAGAAPENSVLANARHEASRWLKDLHTAGAKELYLIATLADVPDTLPFVVVPLGKDADEKALTAALKRLAHFDRTFADPVASERPLQPGPLDVQRIGDALVWGTLQQRKRLRTQKSINRPDIATALADSGPARLVLVPTTDAARILEETMPTLPDELGGGSVKVLSRGLKSITLDLDIRSKLQLRLTVRAADAASAKALDAMIAKGLKSLTANKALKTRLPAVDKLTALWKPKQVENHLELRLNESALVEMGAPLVLWAIKEEQRARASAQMHHVLQVILAFEQKNGTFPAFASRDREGKPLLSWRVHLLPYLGESALYREFKLNEPWDSAHNKKLIARMPAVFRPLNPRLAGEHRTTLLAPLGDATMFPPRGGLRIADVLDGTDKTIILVDAADDQAVVWTRPEDLKYDPKDPFHGLAKRYDGEILIGTVDGMVHFLPKTFDRTTLAGLFTRNGGERVEIP